MVARRAHNPKVIGSSPVPATIIIKRLYYYSVTVFYVKKTLYRYLPGTSVKPPAIIKPAQNSIIIDLE